MPIKYAYIIGCSVILVFWLFMFLRRKDLRKEMLWASFFGMPFGFIDFFLVPSYWNPDSLFDLIKTYGVGIESFIFLFAMSGVASVIYQFLWKKKKEKIIRGEKHHFWIILFISFVYVALSVLFPFKAVYNLMVVGVMGVIIIAHTRKDLREQIFFSGFIFSIFYFGVFALVNFICEGFVEGSYNLKNTLGILIVGIPLEEILVAFFVGAFWSVVYEYVMAHRS